MSDTPPQTRIAVTPAAGQAITRLRADRGAPVMFVQSGGCCAGSTPMCFPAASSSSVTTTFSSARSRLPVLHRCRSRPRMAPGQVHPRRRDRPGRGLFAAGRRQPAFHHPFSRVRDPAPRGPRTQEAHMTVYAPPANREVPPMSRPDTTTGSAASTSPPVKGQYFENPTPVTGQAALRGGPLDRRGRRKALDAAHAAAVAGSTSPAYRANILNRIADRIEANLETLAFIETIDNGKPIRETPRGRPAAGRRSLPLLRRLHPGPGGQRCPSSTRTPSPITSTSRSAWSARSSPGTSRC